MVAQSHRLRVVILQRSLKIAKDALTRIQHGCRDPQGVAEEAATAVQQPELQLKPTIKEKPHGR